MDTKVEVQLSKLKLPNVSLIPLSSLESDALLKIKPSRSVAEYCWTLTPFLPAFVMKNEPTVSRVTYLDADLFFFRPPSILLEELDRSGASALITEHAYDPRYDQSATAGRFCVQFVTFLNVDSARKILNWWQERCIEWCFARHEDGKFGDQKYLDQWPELFGRQVHIVENKKFTLAPWNAHFFLKKEAPEFLPVFFHFHGLRLNNPRTARLFVGYFVGSRAMRLYDEYVSAIGRAASRLAVAAIPVPFFPEEQGIVFRLRSWRQSLLGRRRTARIG
jgi:hypothetical protein